MSLRERLDALGRHFEPGNRWARLHPLFEMVDSFLFTTGKVTRGPSHVRDGMNLKRMMMTVVIALLPCMAMAVYNTGLQSLLAIERGAAPLADWRMAAFAWSGLALDAHSPASCVVIGALYFLPVLGVTYAAGGAIEVGSAILRGHEINEGFFVTGALIPLTLPPTIPLWQVALGTAFGVLFGKEVFGGTGMNFLNPALTARAFLFFAYPARMSGDAPWTAANLSSAPRLAGVDIVSGATPLSKMAEANQDLAELDWWDAFLGLVPGSMGETSALACVLGAALLIFTRVASWRIIAGVALGTLGTCTLLGSIGSLTNPLFAVPFHWHLVTGGWALGTVFMATDPVTSTYTDRGRWLYGAGIGALCVLIRVVNPAYPEGMMLAILFMNIFAPLIDHFIIRANIRRRLARSGA